jgi:hypothetical protein
MSRYYRHNPNEPVRHDWLAGARCAPSTDRFTPDRHADLDLADDDIRRRHEIEDEKADMKRDREIDDETD